jgi:hypothetical protein
MLTKNYQLIAVLIILFSSHLWAAESTITNTAPTIQSETKNNNVLYNNAEVTKGTVKSDGFTIPLNGSNKTNSTNDLNLTDEQRQLSQNYIHQGLANRKIQEQCAGENADICNGNDPKASKKIIVQAVSKAYAMFSGMMDDKLLGLKKTPEAPKPGDPTPVVKKDPKTGKEVKEEGENQSDYCKYIPMATETVSMTMQQLSAKSLSSDTPTGETAQKDALLKTAKSHEEKENGANIQAAGWGGTAACYGVMAATGTAMNTGWMVKIGAASFLAYFYKQDADDQAGYAKKVRDIANTLPGKGDCNPVTQKACYCSQPETKNDPTYCLPSELHKKQIAATSNRVSCVDENLKSDPGCNCDRTGTCFEKLLLAQDVNNNLGFGTTGSLFSPIKKLTNGESSAAVLSGSAFNQYAAMAKKKMNEAAQKFPGPPSLTAAERSIASVYQGVGIPATIAAQMASTQVSQAAINSAMAKLNGATTNLPTVASENYGTLNRSVDFTGGNGLNKSKSNKSNNSEDFKSLLGGAKTAGGNNSKVIEFAVQKAQSQNQITKSDVSIFEIISNRYMNSAPRLLDLENQK